MAYPPINSVPVGLRTMQQPEFDEAMAGYMESLNPSITQMNALGAYVDTKADETASSAAAAAASAASSASSAAAAASTAGATKWVSGQVIAEGDNRWSPTDFLTYRAKVNINPSTVDPALAPASWQLLNQQATTYVARTSNTTITYANRNWFIDITGGTFTQLFDSMANLTEGFVVWLRNSGSGDITIPASDGVTNWIMYPGEARLFMKDQANATLKSVVVSPFNKTITASANFIKPPGYAYFEGLIWNGGNGGNKASSDVSGSAGGGCFPFKLPAAALSASTACTVGAGGAGTSVNGSGAIGGASSIGALIVMWPAPLVSIGSSICNEYAAPAKGSTGFEGGSVNDLDGGIRRIVWGGGAGSHYGADTAHACVYGGAGSGACNSTATIRLPGVSIFGGQGGAAGNATSGANGTAPGGAGGPTRTGTKGGDGARGEIRIWGVA